MKKVSEQVNTVNIKQGFWSKLKKPIFVIAPMANVTDVAFRSMFAKYGKPDVMWTEFVSADGLCSPGRKVLLNDLKFSEAERPIVAQLFTGHPDKMEEAAKIVEKLGFDGIDLNMGCPDRAVEKQGSLVVDHFSSSRVHQKCILSNHREFPRQICSLQTQLLSLRWNL